MLRDKEIRNRIAQLDVKLWKGQVYRHMFAGIPPDRENIRGARWNSPRVGAIYTSLRRETALAEANYRLSLESIPLRRDALRTIHRIEIALSRVVDLSEWAELSKFGISRATLDSLDKASFRICQDVGKAVYWHEHEGLLVPSLRGDGSNLVIFPNNQRHGWLFEVIHSEDVQTNAIPS